MNEVWIVDDDSSIRWVLSRALSEAGYEVTALEDAETAVDQLKTKQPDVLMTDIRMPGMSGLDLAQHIKQTNPSLPCIVMTAHTDLDSALASYEAGAFEYLPKPFDLDEAVRLVERAVEPKVPERKSKEINLIAADDEQIIGEAPAMQEVFRAIGRLARSHINVMICGESGSGKELVAGALHRHSPRSKQPFVAINIAAIPAELLETELFGHEKGAFTGAQAQRQGRFEQANGGTLFLDEIGEMPAELQTRLLRVLSDKRFYRVGGRQLVDVNVRVLAATNRDLENEVESGRFREDLYHRLNVIRINLPALRERVEDIPLLAERFLLQSAQELEVEQKMLTPLAMQCLQGYPWPGNVRQLENICRWITVMAPAETVDYDDLPKELTSAQTSSGQMADVSDWRSALNQHAHTQMIQGKHELLEDLTHEFERTLLQLALKFTGGHRQNAAKILGWGRNTLTRKIKELDVH